MHCIIKLKFLVLLFIIGCIVFWHCSLVVVTKTWNDQLLHSQPLVQTRSSFRRKETRRQRGLEAAAGPEV
jgi:hypothetical protein